MAIKLIVTDLDGTLLNDDKEITAQTIETMRRAQAEGILVTVATGRMYTAAVHFAKQIGVDLPVICCNGGQVKKVGEEPIFARHFSASVAGAVIAECYRRDWYVQWYIGDQAYAKEFSPQFFGNYKRIENFNVNEVGADFQPYLNGVIQIVIRDLGGRIGTIREVLGAKFGGQVTFQQHTDISVDVTPQGINKAVGIAALIKTLGIKKEEVMAFGDADNDIAMLAYVGTGVAMENALDQVKEVADLITGDCNHDGVAAAIERYVLKR